MTTNEENYTPPAAATASTAKSSRGLGATGVMLAVVGGLALAGSGATAAVAAGNQLTQSDFAMSADVAGIRSVEVDVSASELIVEFGDVKQAELSVENAVGGGWVLDRKGDELIVRAPDRFGWSFGSWFDGGGRVTLTLPESLESDRIDLDVELSAGAASIFGDYGDLDATLGAGELSVDGSSTSVDANVSAGSADLRLDGVREAELTVSAGDLTAELTGTALEDVSIDVSAGDLTLLVPNDTYNVMSDVSAGDFTHDLKTSSSSTRVIDVTVSAGSAEVRAQH